MAVTAAAESEQLLQLHAGVNNCVQSMPSLICNLYNVRGLDHMHTLQLKPDHWSTIVTAYACENSLTAPACSCPATVTGPSYRAADLRAGGGAGAGGRTCACAGPAQPRRRAEVVNDQSCSSCCRWLGASGQLQVATIGLQLLMARLYLRIQRSGIASGMHMTTAE